jgi:hypothetical protein
MLVELIPRGMLAWSVPRAGFTFEWVKRVSRLFAEGCFADSCAGVIGK